MPPQLHGQPGMQAKQPPISAGQVITGGPSMLPAASRSAHLSRQAPSQQSIPPGQCPALSQAIPSFHDRSRHEIAAHATAIAAVAIHIAEARRRGTVGEDTKSLAPVSQGLPSRGCITRRLDTP